MASPRLPRLVLLSCLLFGCARTTITDAGDAADARAEATQPASDASEIAIVAPSQPARPRRVVPPAPPKRARKSTCPPAVLVGSARCNTSGGGQGGGCGFSVSAYGRRTFIRSIPDEVERHYRRVPRDGGEVPEHIDFVSDDDGAPYVTNDLDPGFPDMLRGFAESFVSWSYAGEWPDSLFLVTGLGASGAAVRAWTGEEWAPPLVQRPGMSPLVQTLPKGAIAIAWPEPLELGVGTASEYRIVHKDAQLALRTLQTHGEEIHVVAYDRSGALHYLRASAEKLLSDEVLPLDPKCGGGNCGVAITFVRGALTIESASLIMTRDGAGFRTRPGPPRPKRPWEQKEPVSDCGPLPHLRRKDPLHIAKGYDVAPSGIPCYAEHASGDWIVASCDDPEDRPDGGALTNQVDAPTHHHYFLFHRTE